MSTALPFAYLSFDGERLSAGGRGPGRRLRVDARCLDGEPIRGAFAHVCALSDETAVCTRLRTER